MPKPTSSKGRGLMSKELALATQTEALAYWTKGYTVERISHILQLTPVTVDKYLNKALDAFVEQWAKPSPEHTFARYASFQLSLVEKLQKLYDTFLEDDDNKQYGAAVSSIKAQSDIMDKVMDKGTSLGVITQRKADRVVNMTQADLRIELQREMETLAQLLDRVDSHQSFTQRRLIALRKAGSYPRRYLARVRKVKRNALGFVTILPDWKYKRNVHDQSPKGIIPVTLPVPNRPTIQPPQVEHTQIDIAVLDDEDRLLAEYKAQKLVSTSSPSNAGYEQSTQTVLSE